MAPVVREKKLSRRPSDRSRRRGLFFPREAAHLLGIPNVDYRQLRRLFALVRYERSLPARRWARFTFRDLIALRVAVQLLGGVRAVNGRGYLQIKRLERVLDRLRNVYGIEDPLTQVLLERREQAVVAQFRGVHFDVGSGQLSLFAANMSRAIASLPTASSEERRSLRGVLRRELAGISQAERLPRRCTPARKPARLAV
jgi:hypothetical protein